MFGPTFASLSNLSSENAIIISEGDHLGKIFFKDAVVTAPAATVSAFPAFASALSAIPLTVSAVVFAPFAVSTALSDFVFAAFAALTAFVAFDTASVAFATASSDFVFAALATSVALSAFVSAPFAVSWHICHKCQSSQPVVLAATSTICPFVKRCIRDSSLPFRYMLQSFRPVQGHSALVPHRYR